MKKLIIILLLSVLYFDSFSQLEYLKDKNATEKLSAKISDRFEKNELSEAFNELSMYWPLPQNEIDDIREQTIRYLNLIEDRFGKTISNEKVKEESISDFAIRETYIVQYEFHAIRLIYTYYKNDQGWMVNGFSWDDQYSEEFIENK